MKHLLVSRLLKRGTVLSFFGALCVMALFALSAGKADAWTCTTQCYGNTCYTNCY